VLLRSPPFCARWRCPPNRGVGGAKGGDQGECGPAAHAADSAPHKRVTDAGSHTAAQPFLRLLPRCWSWPQLSGASPVYAQTVLVRPIRPLPGRFLPVRTLRAGTCWRPRDINGLSGCLESPRLPWASKDARTSPISSSLRGPLRVTLRHGSKSAPLPLFDTKQTCANAIGTSVEGQRTKPLAR
jgi:hypothetical protein